MKYIVIFKAKINILDDEYSRTAQLLREKALTQFNCQKFEAITENDFEIALSYWNTLEDIQTWHKDAEHQAAQRLGKQKWYKDFSVEICEIHRSYMDINN
ncbi:antibiotic biosynthesis monooxygenase family protein [Acinetobacter terrestris]|uniref:antibiotic biosynthesis monooxygenase family protein n=1 Tax=Acinetobacter terrestris TaxID=2529843 RepID=UPI00103C56D3|nr:antibiotic biosynthesis monooxygenase [Acinetobacter terrestris]TCB50571.1 antibiotic biosynthesis monooxygenase [Acinetobacter terrestris]